MSSRYCNVKTCWQTKPCPMHDCNCVKMSPLQTQTTEVIAEQHPTGGLVWAWFQRMAIEPLLCIFCKNHIVPDTMYFTNLCCSCASHKLCLFRPFLMALLRRKEYSLFEELLATSWWILFPANNQCACVMRTTNDHICTALLKADHVLIDPLLKTKLKASMDNFCVK